MSLVVLIYIRVKAHVRVSKTYFFAFYKSNVPGFSLNFCFQKPVPKFPFNQNTICLLLHFIVRYPHFFKDFLYCLTIFSMGDRFFGTSVNSTVAVVDFL